MCLRFLLVPTRFLFRRTVNILRMIRKNLEREKERGRRTNIGIYLSRPLFVFLVDFYSHPCLYPHPFLSMLSESRWATNFYASSHSCCTCVCMCARGVWWSQHQYHLFMQSHYLPVHVDGIFLALFRFDVDGTGTCRIITSHLRQSSSKMRPRHTGIVHRRYYHASVRRYALLQKVFP